MSTTRQWTDRVWNPVTGCSKVSPGCAHCYAETIAERFWKTQYRGIPIVDADKPERVSGKPNATRPRCFTDVQCHPDRLAAPARWWKPARVFVNSMSDLFHEDVPDEFIDRVFAVMALCPQHTFQILTKRAERMRVYFDGDRRQRVIGAGEVMKPSRQPSHWYHVSDWSCRTNPWPLPNVWLGVSVENQHFADERIPLLLQTPAAVRFVSYEPALGPVDFRAWLDGREEHGTPFEGAPHVGGCVGWTPPLDWLICGGESGPKARPCNVEWIRSAVQQCKAAEVACFVKQLGAAPLDWDKAEPTGRFRTNPETGKRQMEVVTRRLRDRKGGDPPEWPADLRGRQYPDWKPR